MAERTRLPSPEPDSAEAIVGGESDSVAPCTGSEARERADGSYAPEGRGQRLVALGQAIRRARGSMTQVALARRLGCPQSSISLWENGKASLTAEGVYRVEAALGLRPGHLLAEAGYVALSPVHPGSRASGRAVRPAVQWRPPAGTPPSFPHRLSAWLDDFGPLIDAACVLRDSRADDLALNALLDSRPMAMLRLGWEVSEALAPDSDGDSAAVGGLVGVTAYNRCRYALWGTGEPTGRPMRLALVRSENQ